MTDLTTDSPSGTRGVSRRAVLKSAAWATPVVAAAVAVPQAMASTQPPCTPVTFTILPDQPSPESQSVTLTASDPLGNIYTCTISSTIGANTVIGQSRPSTGDANWPEVGYTTFNMNTTGSGWNGGEADDGRWDRVYTGFGPTAIVLNQRAKVDPEPNGMVPLGADEQTLTFAFTMNGAPYDPENLSVDIFDITSVKFTPRPNTNPGDGSGWHPNAGPTGWRVNYWDAVGFSVPPSSIAFTGASPYGPGVGAGTIADPYRRANEHEPTVSSGVTSDRFTFPSFPTGTTMKYTNWNNTRGWHFISISGIQFDATHCV